MRRCLDTQEVLDLLPNAPLKLRLVLAIQLAALDVGPGLDVGFGKHGQHAEQDRPYTLDRRPALRRRLVPQRIVAGGMQDRDADSAVGVDWVSMEEVEGRADDRQ